MEATRKTITKVMKTENQVMGQAETLAEQNNNRGPQAKWAARVDDQLVEALERKVKVQVLKDQAELPPGHILVRDLNGEHDVPLNEDQVVDLAEGNVFYAVPACDAPKGTGHQAPPKLAFFVDDRPAETMRPNQTGKTLREMFELTLDVPLFRDYQSPHDAPVALDAPANFMDGPVFYTRRIEPLTIKITINGPTHVYELHERVVEVKKLKQMAGIPLADDLARVVEGQISKPLDDNGTVEVHCGDAFVSYPKGSCSS